MATSAAEIQKLYIAYFNRPADTAGLAFWQARADAAGGVEAIASQFSNSTEYTDLFDGVSNFEIVNTLYINLFGRPAEDAGLKYWAGKLSSGELSIGTVAYTIANSAQNADLVAVTNKVNAADQFTSTLSPDEIIGYSGTSPNAIAKTWLSGITTNPTFDTALNNLDTVQSTAAAARGEISTLTLAATDVFVGKNYNDTINGTAVNLTAGDSIDGGFGVDTLNLSLIGDGSTLVTGLVKNVEKINLTGAAAATVDASFFAGSTEIAVDGNDTTVTAVKAQSVTFNGTGTLNNAVAYDAATKAAAIKLVNATGTVTLNGAALTSATVTGTSSGGTVALADTAGKIAALTVGLAGEATILNVSTMTALTSVNAAGSRGDLTIDTTLLTKLATLTTGSGDDVVTVAKTFNAANSGTAVSVSTGDGADIINVKTSGIAAAVGATPAVTGTVSVDGGLGKDTFNVAATADLAGVSLIGGEGTDTIVLNQVAFTASQYAALTGATTGIEVAQFGAAAVDGSFLTEFATLSFTADGAAVTNASELITTTSSISVSGIGYTAGSGAIASTFGSGAVDVSITATGETVTVNANTAVVRVASDVAAIATTITGDVKDLLTVNVNSTIDPADDTVQFAASAVVTVDATHNTLLQAVTLAGDGTVNLSNAAGVALTTVDASKLGGLDLAGLVTGGLTYAGNTKLAETITLGSGHDVITVASTFKAMDTITGFDAVQESKTAGKSVVDTLVFNGVTIDGAVAGQVSKLTLASSVTSLNDALQAAATASAAQTVAGNNGIVSFQFGGSTYVFKDVVVTGEVAGSLGDTDMVVKLTGSVDLSTNFGTAV
ncbi:MAG TPA: DUF4214 domain-containing protein [Duganella sp.]|jgi:hypothetical protein